MNSASLSRLRAVGAQQVVVTRATGQSRHFGFAQRYPRLLVELQPQEAAAARNTCST